MNSAEAFGDLKPACAEPLEVLVHQRAAFRAFLRRRLGSDTEVDDLLQHALTKVLRPRCSVRQGERSVAWFLRLLRRAFADHRRSKIAPEPSADVLLRERVEGDVSPAERQILCTCLVGLLPRLNQRSAIFIRRVDFAEEPIAQVAESIGLSTKAATVALCRARAELRRELVTFCANCAQSPCASCEGGGRFMQALRRLRLNR